MENTIKISDSEWQIMNILWEKSPLTVSEVADELKGKVTWNKKTINTLLRRLTKKNAIAYHESRYFKYYPIVEKDEAIKSEMDDVIGRIFDSSPKKLLLNLVENEEFSKQDIEELKSVLNSISKED